MLRFFTLLSGYTDYYAFGGPKGMTRYNDPFCAYYLSNDVFTMISSINSKGGILFMSIPKVRIVVEECVFINCSTVGTASDGGVAFISSVDGECNFAKICASHCFAYGSSSSTVPSGQFCYVSGTIGKGYQFKFMSIIFCGPEPPFQYRRSPLHLEKGFQNISATNFSNNFVQRTGGFYSVGSSQLLAWGLTFANNRPSEYHIISIGTGSGSINIYNSNFINNTGYNTEGIINSDTVSTVIDMCVFLNNADTLFSGSLTASNCWINHTTISTGTKITIISMKTVLSTHQLTNFGSAMCITPTPDPTTEYIPVSGDECTPCPSNLPPPSPPQSLPPEPTECFISSDGNSLFILSSIMSFVVFVLWHE